MKVKVNLADDTRRGPIFEATVFCDCGTRAYKEYTFCPTCGKRLPRIDAPLTLFPPDVVRMAERYFERLLAEAQDGGPQ